MFEAENVFEILFNAAPDATVVVNSEGRILLANQQTERLFGYGREDLVGREVEVLIAPRFRGMHAAHRARLADATCVRSMAAGIELYGLRSNGSER